MRSTRTLVAAAALALLAACAESSNPVLPTDTPAASTMTTSSTDTTSRGSGFSGSGN